MYRGMKGGVRESPLAGAALIFVAITGALSGAEPLAAINSQLGGVGYVIAVEYVFYAFSRFACCASSRCSPPSACAASSARAAR